VVHASVGARLGCMSHVTSLQLTIITCTAPLLPLLLLLLRPLPPVQTPQQMLFPFVEIACRLISDFYAPREIAHNHREQLGQLSPRKLLNFRTRILFIAFVHNITVSPLHTCICGLLLKTRHCSWSRCVM